MQERQWKDFDCLEDCINNGTDYDYCRKSLFLSLAARVVAF